MKEIISNLIEKVTLKKALIATAFFLVMLWLIDYSPLGVAELEKITDGVGILDFETRYSADFGYAWLASMGEAGRNFHLTRIMPLDIIFPPSFMLFQFCWLGLLMRKATNRNSKLRFLGVLPLCYMSLDWIENIGITSMLIKYPMRLDGLCVFTGWVTSLKECVILAIIILFVLLISILLIKKIKGASYAKIKR